MRKAAYAAIVIVSLLSIGCPLAAVFAQQSAPAPPQGPIVLPQPFSCVGDPNDNCDEQRPWMRGHIEKYCGRTDAQLAALREEKPGTTILKCDCRHVCNPNDPMAGETGGRTWDSECEAKCDPNNCKCGMKCDSH